MHRFHSTARLALAAVAHVATLLVVSACDRAASTSPGPTPPTPGDGRAPAETGAPAIPDERAFLAQIDRTRGEKDCFLPLRDPPFVPAAEARGMADGELVLGLDLGTAQVCYPILYMNWHEIVEHRMAGLELLACW